MTCIHGLDDVNCPICKINNSTTPENSIKINNFHYNELKPFIHYSKSKKEIINEIIPNISRHKIIEKMTSINPIPEKKLINEMPDFKNQMFKERLDELNINKSKNSKLLKKVSLESPEWKFEE